MFSFIKHKNEKSPKSKQERMEEIQKKINELQPRTEILSSLVRLSPTNLGQGRTLEELKDAYDAHMEIENLIEELHNINKKD